MITLNIIIDQYANGEMDRDNLEAILKETGFSSEIIAIHLLRAEHKKARVQQRHEKGFKLTVSSTLSIPSFTKGNREMGPLPTFKRKGI